MFDTLSKTGLYNDLFMLSGMLNLVLLCVLYFGHKEYRHLWKRFIASLEAAEYYEVETEHIGFGFVSKHQMPLFMVWREWRDLDGITNYAEVLFKIDSPRWLKRRLFPAPFDVKDIKKATTPQEVLRIISKRKE